MCRSLAAVVGAELNIHDDRGAVSGSAALKEDLGLDYCLAAVHGFSRRYPTLDGLLRTYHDKIMGVVEHCDFVDVIAHLEDLRPLSDVPPPSPLFPDEGLAAPERIDLECADVRTVGAAHASAGGRTWERFRSRGI